MICIITNLPFFENYEVEEMITAMEIGTIFRNVSTTELRFVVSARSFLIGILSLV